jgi:hypothetical protein
VKKTVRRAIGLVPLTLLGNCLTSFPDVRDTSDASTDGSTLADSLIDSASECDGGKVCNDTCVANDDLAYGCSPDSCDPCAGENATTACVSAVCVLTACTAGQFDCNGEVSDGCEATACTPTVIAADQYNPWSVRVDATHVYWTNASGPAGLNRVPSNTLGSPEVLVGDADEGDLFLGTDHIYWVNTGLGLIRRLPKMNPTATEPEVVGTGVNPIGVVVDDTYVYWTEAGDDTGGATGSISRATKAGTDQTTLASGLPTPWLLAQDANSLYFTSRDLGAVFRVAKSGGNAQMLAPGLNASPGGIQGWGVVVDDANVYWRDEGFVRRIAKDAAEYSDAGVDPSDTLSSDEPTARFIAIWGSQLAWVSRQTQPTVGMVRTLSMGVTPATLETLATGSWSTHGTELDAKFVYWTHWGSASAATGSVYKLRRKL